MRRLLFALAVLTTACTTTSKTAAVSPANADAAVNQIVHDYVIEFLRLNPMVNTTSGVPGSIPRSSQSTEGCATTPRRPSIGKTDGSRVSSASSSRPMPPDSHRRAASIETSPLRRSATSCICTMCGTTSSAPSTPTRMSRSGPSIFRCRVSRKPAQDLRHARRVVAPRAAEGRAMVSRECQVQLRAGIASGNAPDFRVLYRHGIQSAAAGAKYFDETLPQIASERITGARREQLLAAVRAASPGAAAAYRHFHDFVAATFFDDPATESGIKPRFAGDHFAFGKGIRLGAEEQPSRRQHCRAALR